MYSKLVIPYFRKFEIVTFPCMHCYLKIILNNPYQFLFQFEFIAYPSDILDFEVKDKFAKSRPIISRFLGKFSVQICLLLDQFSGYVCIKINIFLNLM